MSVINKNIKILLLISFCCFLLIILNSCGSEEGNSDTIFEIVEPGKSGVNFVNFIEESKEFYYYDYIYSYNGGGVAANDFNNDGLVDIFFISNKGKNEIYKNLGDFTFSNLSDKSGLDTPEGFNSGVTIGDLNSDGLLDIYVCRAGKYEDNRLRNLLYINKGNFKFEEAAANYNLDDANRSTSATFFDYDNDGFIDVYVVNSPLKVDRDFEEVRELDLIHKDPETANLKGSDKLYRNNGNGSFEDVSKKAGILQDAGFGLNAQVSDLNNDGFLDIHVSNDFEVPDFVYMNRGDGTFEECGQKTLKHMSFYSMGCDIADLNNDGLMDIVTLDMSPDDYIRSKTTMSMTSIPKFQQMVDKGYHYQYMHNMLHENNGNGKYSEVSQLGGIANTDWSWTPLIADFDLDGYNDIYITNGVFRDVIDKDVSNKIKALIGDKNNSPSDEEFLEYTKMLPQQKLTNFFYKNGGDGTYLDKSQSWVLSKPTFSNGAAYADLDNDGDLDIIVNNINEKALLLKNKAVDNELGNYLEISLQGPPNNAFGIGTKIIATLNNGEKIVRELVLSRGYLSSGQSKVHFGLGHATKIERLKVIWPSSKVEIIEDVMPNQFLQLSYENSIFSSNKITSDSFDLFEKIDFNISHSEVVYDDYERQLLLPHKLSQLGPAFAKADLNGDGLDDFYIGGATGFEGQVFISGPNNSIKLLSKETFRKDASYEDIDALFFDADNDGDLDLYVVSGSYEFGQRSSNLQDRLYLNSGGGNFEKSSTPLPPMHTAGSVVAASDFDKDGDLDLFIGGRVIPGNYPHPPRSYLLRNNQGAFTDVTSEIAVDLERIGMVTDAVWNDLDFDGNVELVVTGEWMGIEIFENSDGKIIKSEKYTEMSEHKGWWNKLFIADIDNNGTKDIIAGNLGLNYKFKTSFSKPFQVYTSDFDYNGIEDILLTKFYNDKEVLVRGKQCTQEQIPVLRELITSFADFANRDIYQIVGNNLNQALHLIAVEFRSGVFIQNESNRFHFSHFGNEAQKSTVNGILFRDFDGDDIPDLILAGNNYMSEIETTRADAGIGVYMKGIGNGKFEFIPNYKTNFYADKDVRNIEVLDMSSGKVVVVINNNDSHDLYQVSSN
jgi:hypothetical protein